MKDRHSRGQGKIAVCCSAWAPLLCFIGVHPWDRLLLQHRTMADGHVPLEVAGVELHDRPLPLLIPPCLPHGEAEDLEVLREFRGAVGTGHQLPAGKFCAVRTERNTLFLRTRVRRTLPGDNGAESFDSPAPGTDGLLLRDVELFRYLRPECSIAPGPVEEAHPAMESAGSFKLVVHGLNQVLLLLILVLLPDPGSNRYRLSRILPAPLSPVRSPWYGTCEVGGPDGCPDPILHFRSQDVSVVPAVANAAVNRDPVPLPLLGAPTDGSPAAGQ